MDPVTIQTRLGQFKNDLDACILSEDASNEHDNLQQEITDLIGVRCDKIAKGLALRVENLRLKAMRCHLRYDNAVLTAEVEHSRRVIRELVLATDNVVGSVEYKTEGAKNVCFYETVQRGKAAGGQVSTDHLYSDRIAAVQRYQVGLGECLAVVETEGKVLLKDIAEYGAEVAAGVEAWTSEVGEMVSGLKRDTEVVVRDLNMRDAAAGKTLENLEKDVKSQECSLSAASTTLQTERENRDSDLREIYLRSSGALIDRTPVLSAVRTLSATQRSITSETTTKQALITDLTNQISHKRQLLKAGPQKKCRSGSAARAKQQIAEIKEALNEAERSFAAHAGCSIKSGRLAKNVRFDLAREKRVAEVVKEPGLVY